MGANYAIAHLEILKGFLAARHLFGWDDKMNTDPALKIAVHVDR